MMRRPWFNYSQEYIPHAYLELCIPMTENGGVSCIISNWSSSKTSPTLLISSLPCLKTTCTFGLEVNLWWLDYQIKTNRLLWPFSCLKLCKTDLFPLFPLFNTSFWFYRFDGITNGYDLIQFFEEHFADSIPLIGREKLIEDYFNTKPLPLISIKCSPYHVSDKCLIMGDAAHAIVPFYGQGMNCVSTYTLHLINTSCKYV